MLVAKTGLLPSPRAEATLANSRLQRGTFLSFPPIAPPSDSQEQLPASLRLECKEGEVRT